MVDVAETAQAYAAAVRVALAQPDQERLSRGIARATASSWEQITIEMSQHMEHAAAARQRHQWRGGRVGAPMSRTEPGVRRTP